MDSNDKEVLALLAKEAQEIVPVFNDKNEYVGVKTELSSVWSIASEFGEKFLYPYPKIKLLNNEEDVIIIFNILWSEEAEHYFKSCR